MKRGTMTACGMACRTVCRTATALLSIVTIACGTGENPQTAPGTSTPEQLFWATELNHRAITMAVGQTLQLKAIAINALGAEMPSLSSNVMYTTTDTARVRVTTDGLVTARAEGTSILVVARIHSDELNVTNTDTARINITATEPVITSFTMQPDSTLIGGDESISFVARAFGPGGSIPAVSARYYSADQAAFGINANTGDASANYLGPVKLWAVATLYGRVWTDTVSMTVTYPVWARVFVTNQVYNDASTPLYAHPYTLTVRKGATVRFQSAGPTAVSVAFDNPGAVTGGNIPASTNTYQERVFPTVGTFTYQISGVPKVGTLKVVE